MKKLSVDKSKFKFRYLPDYADHILKNKLEEFVTVSIRFCRELDLPMLKPLAKMPEKELVALSLESNRQILEGLVKGTISDLIENNLNTWTNNKLEVLDKSEIAIEDMTLGYYIRRKTFAHFLYGYTVSAPIQQAITAEVDAYTSMEELISLKTYVEIQNEIKLGK